MPNLSFPFKVIFVEIDANIRHLFDYPELANIYIYIERERERERESNKYVYTLFLADFGWKMSDGCLYFFQCPSFSLRHQLPNEHGCYTTYSGEEKKSSYKIIATIDSTINYLTSTVSVCCRDAKKVRVIHLSSSTPS